MTGIACVAVPGTDAALPLLDRVGAVAADTDRLRGLREAAGATQVFSLVTCERGELYVAWPGPARPERLLDAVAAATGFQTHEVAGLARVHRDAEAARHLFRVAAGLESFALGETDIVAQVRAAAALAKERALTGTELDRLLDAAVSASRRVHRHTGLGEAGRSMADAAVDAVVARFGQLAGRTVLVVGAGRFAGAVVDRAGSLGTTVVVCNRTRRHAERFRRGGAVVLGLEDLPAALRDCDAAILGTASPVAILDADLVVGAVRHRSTDLLLVDGCVPRNVDPRVRGVLGVTLLDIADLRSGDLAPAWSDEAAAAAGLVDAEVERLRRWWVRRASRRGSALDVEPVGL